MSNRIAEFRKAKRLTQQGLADAMGLHSSVGWQSVHRWEHGKSWPSHANFKALAAALGCRPYELIMEPEDVIDVTRRVWMGQTPAVAFETDWSFPGFGSKAA